ncbi:MAG TPA: efflux RND transporter periplasmic adaptor subunit [Polyangia bacterium]
MAFVRASQPVTVSPFASLRPSALWLLPLVGSLGLLGGCRASADTGKTSAPDTGAPVAVKAVAVEERAMPRSLRLAGTLIASEESEVAAGVAGKIVETFVERGVYLKKGQPIARIDARLAAAASEEASAQLASSRVQRELSKTDCERTQRMFDKGAISKADYDRSHAACTAAQFTESAAAARTLSTGTVLRDSTIRAPFAGVIAERVISPGEYVRADSKVVTLMAVDSLRLELTVPEAYVAQVQDKMELTFRTAAGGNDATAKSQRAVVRYVGPAVRRQSRDLVVEAVVENADRKLRPGMFVVAHLELGDATSPVVPRAAIRSEGSMHRVFVIANQQLEERLVQLGEERDGLVAVLTGVHKGDKVVATAAPELRDGLRVQ